MSEHRPWGRLGAEMYAWFGRCPRSNRSVAEHAAVGPGDRVLDIGCGPGAAVRLAAGRGGRAVGLDNSAPMARIAARRSRRVPVVGFVVGAAEALPLRDRSFDVAWTVYAFHHWSDRAQGLAEARRVLVDGGRLLVVERRGRGKHALSDADAERLAGDLAATGFADVAVTRVRKELVVSGVRRA